MPDILGQLFGQPQQPQGDGGMVQSILQQRFQPSTDDVNQATAMSAMQRNYVSPTTLMQQQIGLQNQMTQNMMPYMMGQVQDLYGNPQQSQQPQQDGNIPPVGFPANQNQPAQPDPRIRKAEIAAMMGNKALSDSLMAEYQADPTVIAQKAEAGKSGETSAENAKTLNVMSANLPVVMQRLQEMEDAVPDASYGLGVNNEGTGIKQQSASQFGYDKANTILQQRAAQGVLPELGPQLAQAGIRGNKFLETLASSASGLNMAASPKAKTAAIQGLREQYISNLKSTARQVRAQGGQAPSDAEIDATVAKYIKSTGNLTGAPQAAGKGNNLKHLSNDDLMKALGQ